MTTNSSIFSINPMQSGLGNYNSNVQNYNTIKFGPNKQNPPEKSPHPQSIK